MGKTRKGFKNEIRAQEKTPLDEQITSGKVVRSKNKVKIRLRAEEEDVSINDKRLVILVQNKYLLETLSFSMSMHGQHSEFCMRLERSKRKLH